MFEPSDGLSMPEGEVVALVFNPELRLARLRTGVSAATAEHAGLWQDPQFGVDVLTLTENASNPLLITPGLGFTVPISGRLGAERARADAALAAELAGVVEREWLTRIEVRRAWLGWSAARLKADETERMLASLGVLAASTAKLAEAGEMLRTEAALFSIEAARQGQALLGFRGEASASEQELRALLGLPPGGDLELVPSVAMGGDAAELTPEAAAERSPTLARLRVAYEVAEQTLRREVREQYPDLTIGPLAEFDRGDTLLGFSLYLPIPILNANRQGIAEAHAEREVARAAFETGYERIAGSIAASRARLSARRELREGIESALVPLVDRQLADAQNLLRLGEGGGLVLLESLTRAGETRMALIDARVGESLAMVDLVEMVGPPAHPAPGDTEETDTPEVNP